jgi:serine/threonine-protein kinase
MGHTSSAPSAAFDEGRFPPGTLLADRYRIVGILGRGGMGEVYRANDLRLGQPVALKFLPPGNRHLLERFHGEVRIARQVSHPHVCRVYDIAEWDGELFLSMEYVDGEDLGSLLRRIGRLPQDKAIEIARKLCAGLAAAHDRGVLHRDLKPANVMLDSRGHVRIMDFGLAGLAGQIEGGDIRSGTPAYMAPEQRAGTEVTPRSDLYALGVVMFEMVTGKLPSEERVSQHLDAAVERVIRRCLEDDPKLRPASALAVAAALPGGDPLAAALAAGETPSPEMVAAAGETAGFSMRTAAICLAIALAGLAASVIAGAKANLITQIPFEHSPDVLAQKARELIQRFGYRERPQDQAYAFSYAGNFLRYARRSESPGLLQEQLSKGQPPAMYFWYRQSPQYFAPRANRGAVTTADPPMTLAGMIRTELDPAGRLISFRAVTPDHNSAAGPSTPPDWNMLLEAAGADASRFSRVDPEWFPLAATDARAAWTGSFVDSPKVPVRLEAAAWHGRPVYFQAIGPWTQSDSTPAAAQSVAERVSQWIGLLVVAALLIAAAWIAWRHWKSGRGDLRGASKLAGVVFAGEVVSWALRVPHTPTTAEYVRISLALGAALLQGAACWVLYVALEPYVRRRWPQSLISWSRLVGGAWRDSLVAGHVLLGIAAGMGFTLLFLVNNHFQVGYAEFQPDTLQGILHRSGAAISMTVEAAGIATAIYFQYFLFRVFFRKAWLAAPANVVFIAIATSVGAAAPVTSLIANGVVALAAIGMLTQFGLLPMIVAITVSTILPGFPMTSDFSAWYADSTMFAVGVVLILTFCAFHLARAGRPIFGKGVLDQ